MISAEFPLLEITAGTKKLPRVLAYLSCRGRKQTTARACDPSLLLDDAPNRLPPRVNTVAVIGEALHISGEATSPISEDPQLSFSAAAVGTRTPLFRPTQYPRLTCETATLITATRVLPATFR